MGARQKWCQRTNIQNIPLHIQELNYIKCVYELEGHFGEKVLSSNLLPLFGPSKKPLASFPNCLLKSTLVEPAFFYALLPCHKRVKQNTIGITKEACAELPHHREHVPAYQIKNKMPLIHHTIKSYGCNYTIKDDKNLNERICGHPMMKPKCQLM